MPTRGGFVVFPSVDSWIDYKCAHRNNNNYCLRPRNSSGRLTRKSVDILWYPLSSRSAEVAHSAVYLYYYSMYIYIGTHSYCATDRFPMVQTSLSSRLLKWLIQFYPLQCIIPYTNNSHRATDRWLPMVSDVLLGRSLGIWFPVENSTAIRLPSSTSLSPFNTNHRRVRILRSNT